MYFFWGHQTNNQQLTKSCFSQWYESKFVAEGVHYLTAEHYMMHKKALLFNDLEAAEKVLKTPTAAKVKKVGREIQGFNGLQWQKHRFDIVVHGNLAKFSSSPMLKEFLINTGDSILVEASPVDKIWGIGLASDDPNCTLPNNWQGLNLLGYALMEVRSQLMM